MPKLSNSSQSWEKSNEFQRNDRLHSAHHVDQQLGEEVVRKKQKDMWVQLEQLIKNYADAVVTESWKGGGDPADIPVIDAMLELERIKLQRHIDKMKQEFM